MATAPANDYGDPLANTEIEADLLGALMRENELVDQVADHLTADDFASPLHGRIYAAIVNEVSVGKSANPATLKSYFETDRDMQREGGIVYLASMTGAFIGMNIWESAQALADLSQRRKMRDGLRLASGYCDSLSTPITDIIATADAAVATKADDGVSQLSGAECFEDLVRSFDEPNLGVTCSQIPALDELHGPMRPGQLVLLAARPGMGKTAVALSYSIGAAWNGHGVLFVSLEMRSTELAGRMAADMCFEDKVPYSAIRDRKLNDFQRRAVQKAGVQMARLPFNVADAGTLTIGRLSTIVRRNARRMAAEGFPLELVVVDYLQLLHANQRGRGRYEEVSEVSQALKAMAKDQGVAVLALAQLSREVEKRPDKRPQLSDLRDSGQLEQDADSVIFLMRSEYYLRQEEPDPMDPKRFEWDQAMQQVQGQIEFILAKCRNGVTGNSVGQFHGAYQAVR